MKKLVMSRHNLALGMALVLLLVALFKPAIPMKREVRSYLFVVDVTQSMNTVDMALDGKRVSRIAFARALLGKTLSEIPCGTMISLGVFSAESVALLFTPIEVCANYAVVQDSIANLEWRMAWRGNSRLRFGLPSAAALVSLYQTPARVIFMTDGDEAPKLNAVNKTDLSGWQGGRGWLLVGIGGDEPSPIPKFDSDDKILGYWAYSNSILAPSQVQSEESVGTRDSTIASDVYDRYLSQLDETYLRELAEEIGAKYLRGHDPEGLGDAMEDMEPAGELEAEARLDGWLIIAAMLLLLSSYARSFRDKLQGWRKKLA
jgi:mxaL protein